MIDTSFLIKLSAAVDEKESKGFPVDKKKEEKKEETPKKADEKAKVDNTPKEEGSEKNVDNIPKEEGSEKMNEGKQAEGEIKEDAPAEAVVGQPQPTQMPQNTLSLIMDFFSQNPNPQDVDFQSFVEQNGMDVSQANSIAYALASKTVNLLRSGASVEEQLDPNTVDPEQLQMGIEIEQRHTTDIPIAKKLALDNLTIHPEYYSLLQNMFNQLDEEENAAAVPTMNKNDQYNGESQNTYNGDNAMPVGTMNATEG